MYSADFARAIDREHSLEPVRRLQAHVRGQNTLDAMLYIDTKTWLPDDLLIKADKMTMANSVELRVPLLDHRSGIRSVTAAQLQAEWLQYEIHFEESAVAENSERDPQPEEDRIPGTLRVLASERSQGCRLGCVDGPQDNQTRLFP